MKILFVTEFFPTGKDLRFSGGVEARTYFVAKHLAKRHKVSVICSRQPRTKKIENIDGINVHRVGPTLEYYATGKGQDILTVLKFIFSSIKIGSQMTPDIVEGNNFLSHFISKQIAQKVKIPVVYWYPDVFLGQWIKTSGLLVGSAGWLLEKINLHRGADYYVTISKTALRKLLKSGIAHDKITVIPCGIESSEFKFKVLKQKYTTIVCISRLVTYKRVQDLIWAFALICKNKSDLRMIIVGRGPEEKRLKEICKMLEISSKVSFVSNLRRNDLIKTIKSAHLFCLPSETEGFGISIIESSASGVPYVASGIDVFKEITKNGQGGLIFKLGDIKDLASKINKLFEDHDLYQKKSKEAINLAKNYEWSEIAMQTEKVYRNLL